MHGGLAVHPTHPVDDRLRSKGDADRARLVDQLAAAAKLAVGTQKLGVVEQAGREVVRARESAQGPATAFANNSLALGSALSAASRATARSRSARTTGGTWPRGNTSTTATRSRTAAASLISAAIRTPSGHPNGLLPRQYRVHRRGRRSPAQVAELRRVAPEQRIRTLRPDRWSTGLADPRFPAVAPPQAATLLLLGITAHGGQIAR